MTTGVLMTKLLEDYNPNVESLADHCAKKDRLVVALEMMGETVDLSLIQKLAAKNEYIAMLHPMAEAERVPFLKALFGSVLIETEIDEEVRTAKMAGLMDLLRERGQKVSTNMEKLFSSFTGTPAKLTPEKLEAQQRLLGSGRCSAHGWESLLACAV